MKIHGKDTNIDSLKGVFSDSRVSGSKITLLAQRILDASERPEKVANITASLEKKGYSEFTVRFDLDGKIEIADSGVFEKGLAKWVNQEGGKAGLAARAIRGAFYENSTTLDLSNFDLKSLPAEIGNLTSLVYLNLENNQLKSLPAEIGSLTSLGLFSVSNNQLQSLPAEIGNLTSLGLLSLDHNPLQSLPAEIGNLTSLVALNLNENILQSLPAEIGNLTSLVELHLFENLLKSLPVEIGNLTHLTYLDLEDNRLQSLPAEIGNLTSLREFNLSNNILPELPLALGNCSQLTAIDIRGTRIPQANRNAILDLCRAHRDAEALQVLPVRLKAWETFSGQSFQFAFIDNLTLEEKQVITGWLTRLEKTKDFTACQKPLAETVCGILQSLQDPAFKETFFAQVPVNLEHCGDRAAMALNEIFLAWKLATLPNASVREQLSLMVRAAKTNALRAALQQKIDQKERADGAPFGESVQVFLYYETELKERLNLLTVISGMLYRSMGKSDWIDEKALVEEVNSTYLDHIVEFPALETFLAKDKDFNAKWEPMADKFVERMEEVESRKNEMREGDYKAQMDGLKHERELAYKDLARKYIQERV